MLPDEPQIDTRSKLAGTVKLYTRHLIVCSGHNQWPARVEEAGGFVTALNEAFKESSSGPLTRITACDWPSIGPGTDLLVYPDAIRLQRVLQRDLPALRRFLEVGQSREFETQPLKNPLFLVCVHKNRDPRCGRCGPKLYAKFQETLDQLGLEEEVEVTRSSHLGGHRFAGIVVSYPSGNWYGRVTQEEVPALLQAEIQEKQPYAKLWRGRMGWNVMEQLAFAERLGR